MVIDTSALIAILQSEPERREFVLGIEQAERGVLPQSHSSHSGLRQQGSQICHKSLVVAIRPIRSRFA